MTITTNSILSASFMHGSIAAVLFLGGAALGQASNEKSAAVTFDQLQPVLKKRCGSCHGRNEAKAGLDLSTLAAIKAGSDSGPVAIAGKPEDSILYNVVAHVDGPKMPPGKERIQSSELKLFHDWIADGMLERPSMQNQSVGGSESVERMAVEPPVSLPPIVPVSPLRFPTATTALAIHPTGETIALSGVEQVVLLDARTHAPLKAFPFPEGEVFSLRYSRDGKWLVAGGGKGGASGKAVVFNATTGERLLESPEDRDTVLSADISPDGKRIAWGGPSRTVKIMNTETRKVTATLTGPTDWVLSVSFSPDGRLVAGSDRFGGLRVWSLTDSKEFMNLRGHTGAIPSIVWSPNSDHLLSVGEDATVRMWDLHTAEQSSIWTMSLGGLWSVDWHKSNVIAIGGRNKKAMIMDSQGNKLFEVPLADEATEILFSRDGSQVFVADANGRILSIAVNTGTLSAAFSLPIAASVAKVETPWPRRTRPVKEPSIPSSNESTVGSPEEALLQAVMEAEEAVTRTEESLTKLKQNAARLRQLLTERKTAKP